MANEILDKIENMCVRMSIEAFEYAYTHAYTGNYPDREHTYSEAKGYLQALVHVGFMDHDESIVLLEYITGKNE